MRLQSVPRSKVFWEAKCVSATFSDDYFARYRFLLFCAKMGLLIKRYTKKHQMVVKITNKEMNI